MIYRIVKLYGLIFESEWFLIVYGFSTLEGMHYLPLQFCLPPQIFFTSSY